MIYVYVKELSVGSRIKSEDLFVKNGKHSNTSVRRRVESTGILGNKCAICGTIDWVGKPLSLQLHHINKDIKDNRVENLQRLCRNCHLHVHRRGKTSKLRDSGQFFMRHKPIPKEEVFVKNSTLGPTTIKLYLSYYESRGGVCEICGISEWLGDPLNTELHHISGVRKDQRLNNLQLICGSCHSQTKNYAAKKNKGVPRGSKRSDQEIIEAAEEAGNIKELAANLGLSAASINTDRFYALLGGQEKYQYLFERRRCALSYKNSKEYKLEVLMVSATVNEAMHTLHNKYTSSKFYTLCDMVKEHSISHLIDSAGNVIVDIGKAIKLQIKADKKVAVLNASSTVIEALDRLGVENTANNRCACYELIRKHNICNLLDGSGRVIVGDGNVLQGRISEDRKIEALQASSTIREAMAKLKIEYSPSSRAPFYFLIRKHNLSHLMNREGRFFVDEGALSARSGFTDPLLGIPLDRWLEAFSKSSSIKAVFRELGIKDSSSTYTKARHIIEEYNVKHFQEKEGYGLMSALIKATDQEIIEAAPHVLNCKELSLKLGLTPASAHNRRFYKLLGGDKAYAHLFKFRDNFMGRVPTEAKIEALRECSTVKEALASVGIGDTPSNRSTFYTLARKNGINTLSDNRSRARHADGSLVSLRTTEKEKLAVLRESKTLKEAAIKLGMSYSEQSDRPFSQRLYTLARTHNLLNLMDEEGSIFVDEYRLIKKSKSRGIKICDITPSQWAAVFSDSPSLYSAFKKLGVEPNARRYKHVRELASREGIALPCKKVSHNEHNRR